MMASLLLDSIINDTIKPLGGRELLQYSRVAPVHSNRSSLSLLEASAQNVSSASTQAQQNATTESGVFDQIDSLTSLMQDVDMGPNERLFWIILFSIMVLVAAGGNIIVIYIVSTNKEMKSVTNYFLVNLSLADTMVSTLNVIFNFISMLNSHWPFGNAYCKISNFIAILSIAASVFTLTAISCDRYNAIIHPLRPRMSHRHALAWILLIWTLSSALALPNIIYSVVVEDRLVNENLAFTCTMIWPDGRYPVSSYDHIYNIIIMVLTYLVPISTMAILYYKVGKELWGYEAIGEDVEKQRRALKAKKKIVKMMIVVVIMFALCWLPYHAFFVVNYYLPTIFADGPLYYQRCFLFMYWLAMSNSMYNPIIIYFMNSKIYSPFSSLSSNANSKQATQRAQVQQQQQQQLQQNDNGNQQPLALNQSQGNEERNCPCPAGGLQSPANRLKGSQPTNTDSLDSDTCALASQIEVVVTTHNVRQYSHQLAAGANLPATQEDEKQLQTGGRFEQQPEREREPFLAHSDNHRSETDGSNDVAKPGRSIESTGAGTKVWI